MKSRLPHARAGQVALLRRKKLFPVGPGLKREEQ
jgi:hypothetical protein